MHRELLEGIQNGPPSVSPRPSGTSLSPSISSRVEIIFTSSTRSRARTPQSVAPPSPPALSRLKAPRANMQISQARSVCERDEEPCNCLLGWITRAIRGHRGGNYALSEARPGHPFCPSVPLAKKNNGFSKGVHLKLWLKIL